MRELTGQDIFHGILGVIGLVMYVGLLVKLTKYGEGKKEEKHD